MENRKKKEPVGDILRFWRKVNRISQMDLALDVGVSSKHLSFVETGKSRPSRQLILKIADSLQLPFRQRNAFLLAGGYASEFEEEPFDGQKMEIIRQALHRMLEKHEPYPALVINATYKILMTNSGLNRLLQFYVGEDVLRTYDNVYHITFAEDGLRQYIQDWQMVENFMLARLWGDVVSTQNSELIALYDDISETQTGLDSIDFKADQNLPVMTLSLEKNSNKNSFFTTITTLGTPLDLTTQELRIELLFPADEETRQFCHAQET